MSDRSAAIAVLSRQRIELPSWAFGNSGTRFKVFAQPGVPRDPFEKVADAAQVHRHTGLAPSVALHIPWDRVDDFDKLVPHANECVGIMDVTRSRDLKVWLPDGLNYPGQADLRDRQERLADSLAQIY